MNSIGYPPWEKTNSNTIYIWSALSQLSNQEAFWSNGSTTWSHKFPNGLWTSQGKCSCHIMRAALEDKSWLILETHWIKRIRFYQCPWTDFLLEFQSILFQANIYNSILQIISKYVTIYGVDKYKYCNLIVYNYIEEKTCHSLVNFPKVWGWAQLNPGARDLTGHSMWMQRPRNLCHLSLLFKVRL